MSSFKTAFENLKYGLFAPDHKRDPKLSAQRNLFGLKSLCFLAGMAAIPSYNVSEIIFRNPFTVADDIKLERTLQLVELQYEKGEFYDDLRRSCETVIRENWPLYSVDEPMVDRAGKANPRYEQIFNHCMGNYKDAIQANMDAVSPWKILTAQSLAALLVGMSIGMGFGAINHADRAHRRARELKL